MVLVGAVISLARIPLSMSSSPGAPSLVAALSSVGLIWPFLGESLIVIATVRAVAARVASRSLSTRTIGRVAIKRRAGVALVGIGGAILLTLPLLAILRGAHAVFYVVTARGTATMATVLPASGLDRALFWSWILCLFVGASLLIASEIELRRRA